MTDHAALLRWAAELDDEARTLRHHPVSARHLSAVARDLRDIAGRVPEPTGEPA